jgi:hypothetical protein
MLSQSHVLSGVFGVITSVGWAVQTVFGGWLYKRVWDFKNNNEGISFQNVSRGVRFLLPECANSEGDGKRCR